MRKVLASVFDLHFRRFITPSVVKVLYIITVIVATLASLMIILFGFRAGIAEGLGALIIALFMFFLIVLVARVGLETLVSIFRIANYSAEIARANRTVTEDEFKSDVTVPKNSGF